MSLKDSIESVKSDFLTEFASINDSAGSEIIRQKYLGRNGLVTNLFKELGRASNDDRPAFGQLLNQLKKELSEIRLDQFLKNNISELSRTRIKKLIINGFLKLNSKIIIDPSYIVKENDISFC